MLDSCFRQVEFAGVLKGTEHAAAARKLVDFMLSARFQADMPLQMFVFPVPRGNCRSRRCSRSSPRSPADPLSLPAAEIGRNRDAVDRAVDRPPCCGERRSRARVGGALLAIVPIAFLAVFFAYPVIAIVGRGLAPDGALDLDPLREVVDDPGAAPRHRGSRCGRPRCRPCSRWPSRFPARTCSPAYDFPGRRVVRALVTVPFVLPTVVVGSAFAALLGAGGPLAGLGLDQTVWAILLAHVFFNYAVVVRTVGGLWAHLDPHQEEAARDARRQPAGARSAR